MSVISAAAFRNQLDRWGVDYIEHTRHDRCLGRAVDWSEHEARRGCARRGWDAHGIAIHHSGGPTSWEFVWDGRSNVPGPLYTVLIYPDGKAHLTGFRITNNVGRCDATVRNRVLGGEMPTSGGNVSPGGDDYSAANSEFYGISYRGTAPTADQRRTALLICAAICSAHGSTWDGGSVAGHKELTRRKPDPERENMSAFRADLNDTLQRGPGGDMATPKEIWRWDELRPPRGRENDNNPKWQPRRLLEVAGDLAASREFTSPYIRDKIREGKGAFTRWLIEWTWHYAKGARKNAREAREAARANGKQIGELAAQVSALSSAVEQLASGGIDLEAVQQAAEQGAATAWRNAEVSVTFDDPDEPDDEDTEDDAD